MFGEKKDGSVAEEVFVKILKIDSDVLSDKRDEIKRSFRRAFGETYRDARRTLKQLSAIEDGRFIHYRDWGICFVKNISNALSNLIEAAENIQEREYSKLGMSKYPLVNAGLLGKSLGHFLCALRHGIGDGLVLCPDDIASTLSKCKSIKQHLRDLGGGEIDTSFLARHIQKMLSKKADGIAMGSVVGESGPFVYDLKKIFK